MNSITFHGAVEGSVTGSKIMVSSWQNKVLLDCGAFQGRRDDAYLANAEYALSPLDPDYVVLSHSHLDHSGMLPSLYKHGYSGTVLCTSPTYDLTKYMLNDSVKIMKKDLPVISNMFSRRGIKAQIGLIYDEKNVSDSCDGLRKLEYREPKTLTDEIDVELFDNGHILGSSSVKLTVDQHGTKHNILYSSDLGARDSILSKKPDIPDNISHLIIETTYGNKDRSTADPVQTLADEINKTIKRGGRVIIPAFSVHRMQTIILILHKLYNENIIPSIPVYVDSPLGNKVTSTYRRYQDQLNEETIKYFTGRGEDPFDFSMLQYVNSQEFTEEIAAGSEQCIIVSASGMMEGGTIRSYAKYNITDSKNHFLLVGYTAQGTLGRRLLEGRNKRHNIDGKQYVARCQTSYIEGFSAHADIEYLLDYVDICNERGGLKAIYLIHGESNSVYNVQRRLRQNGYRNVIVPIKGKEYKL
jgi:metallo-beta-lactamase family protein